MSHVQGFNSMEEMFDAMGKAEDAANAGLTPGQIALRDDVESTCYWVQPVPDWGMVIYGVTPPIADVQADAHFDVAENRSRGYLTGTAHSDMEPRGEYGDTHVSQVIPITAEIFESAKALLWPTLDDLRKPDPEMRALGAALAVAERVALGRQ